MHCIVQGIKKIIFLFYLFSLFIFSVKKRGKICFLLLQNPKTTRFISVMMFLKTSKNESVSIILSSICISYSLEKFKLLVLALHMLKNTYWRTSVSKKLCLKSGKNRKGCLLIISLPRRAQGNLVTASYGIGPCLCLPVSNNSL